MPRNLAKEEEMREQSAMRFRDLAGQPMQGCPAGCGFSAIGPPWARHVQFHSHWLACRGVSSLSFHPDGSLASVTFRR